MDDDFRRLVLELAGPSRDRARLARLLHISESTAYGWIRLSEQGSLSPATGVRGDANRAAIAALARAVERRKQGVPLQEIEAELDAELRDGSAETQAPSDADAAVADRLRRAALQRGLNYALKRLSDGASVEEVVAAAEAVLAMSKEGR